MLSTIIKQMTRNTLHVPSNSCHNSLPCCVALPNIILIRCFSRLLQVIPAKGKRRRISIQNLIHLRQKVELGGSSDYVSQALFVLFIAVREFTVWQNKSTNISKEVEVFKDPVIAFNMETSPIQLELQELQVTQPRKSSSDLFHSRSENIVLIPILHLDRNLKALEVA